MLTMMMMMMIVMIIVIIIIIIAFKRAIRDFQNLLTAPAPTIKWPGRNRMQITCNTPNASQVQHVLHVTWYERTAQLLSLTEFKPHLFSLYLLAEPSTNEGGGEES